MNFAAPALLLVLLLLPGVVARTAYLRGKWDTHPYRTGAISEEIAFGALVAACLHLLWGFVAHLAGYRVRLDFALALLYGPAQNSDAFGKAVANVSANVSGISAYMISLYVFSWFAGYGAHAFVRSGRLDLQTRVFRFSHDWHYLMSGEILDLDRPHGPFQADLYNNTLVAVLVGLDEGSYIYRGRLRRYHFGPDGQLDRLVLEFPERAKFSEVREQESPGDTVIQSLPGDPFVSVAGQYMVILCKDIITINVLFSDAD